MSGSVASDFEKLPAMLTSRAYRQANEIYYIFFIISSYVFIPEYKISTATSSLHEYTFISILLFDNFEKRKQNFDQKRKIAF